MSALGLLVRSGRSTSETIAAFHERDWAKAQLKAKEPLKAALASKPEQEMKTKLQLTITVTFSKRLAPRREPERGASSDAANHLAGEGFSPETDQSWLIGDRMWLNSNPYKAMKLDVKGHGAEEFTRCLLRAWECDPPGENPVSR